jgi:hypothetical protein
VRGSSKSDTVRFGARPYRTTQMATAAEVEIISAEWCKRCHEIKPEVAKVCALIGAKMTVVDYDDLDDGDDLKNAITSLPTIRMRSGPAAAWKVYTAATFETWKTDAMSLGVFTTSEDF